MNCYVPNNHLCMSLGGIIMLQYENMHQNYETTEISKLKNPSNRLCMPLDGFYLTLYKTMCIIIVRKRCVCLLTINV